MRQQYEPKARRAFGTVILLPCIIVFFFLFVHVQAGILCLLMYVIEIGLLFAIEKNYAQHFRSDWDAFKEWVHPKPHYQGELVNDKPQSEEGSVKINPYSNAPQTTNSAQVKSSAMWEQPRVYTIKLPKDTHWNASHATTLIMKFFHLGRLILRIQATAETIVWQLIDVNEIPCGPDEVSRAIRSAYINAEISDPELLEEIDVNGGHWRRVDYYRQTQEWLRPSLQADDIQKADPLTAIVNGMIDLREDEWVSYLMAFGLTKDDAAPSEELFQEGYEDITTSKTAAVALGVLNAALSEHSIQNGIGAGLGAGVWGAWKGNRPDKYPPDVMRACVKKTEGLPFLRCYIAMEANSPDPNRLDQFNFYTTFLKQFSTQYQLFDVTSDPKLHITSAYDEQKSNCVSVLTRLLHKPLLPLEARANVFIASEMAALWHLPHDEMKALEIGWVKGKQVAAPMEFRGERPGVLLGVNKTTRANIYQPLSERTVHTLIIGKTGTGKTSFMQGLVQQDIQAGNGVAVIDPLGGMVRRILQHGIPPEREGDVVVLDIGFEFEDEGNKVYPPPLNPLAKLAGTDARKSAGDFAAVLGKLYEDTSQTRWMQTIQAALELLTAQEHATLYDMWKVIDDPSYRKTLISKFDFNVAQKWERLDRGGGLSDSGVQAAVWRLGQFLDVEIARASTCHPERLNFYSLIRSNKIILVSVHADEGLVPKSAQNVLGALVLSQIQMAAMAGAVADPKKRPFILYVDEVQDFATSSLDELARQARQKGLGLVVATQDTSTIAPKTLKALKGNLGTLVAFECNAEDAKNALDMMPEYTVSDLMNMGRFKTVISMRSADGTSRAAFSVEPVAGADVSDEASIQARELTLRHKSVVNYTPKSYDDINSWLDARYRPDAQQAQNKDEQNDFGNPIT